MRRASNRNQIVQNQRTVDTQASSKMSEKLCLKWNDFQENVNVAFASLREDNDFADVTLACEDGQQIEAHKVILTASSQTDIHTYTSKCQEKISIF